MDNYEVFSFSFPICFSRKFRHWNKDFTTVYLVLALVSKICCNLLELGFTFQGGNSCEMKERNIPCTEGLFHLLSHPHTDIFPLAAYYTNKKVSWFPTQYITQPAKVRVPLPELATGRTHVGLNYHRIFPGHSGAARDKEMVSLIGSFINQYIN